MPAQMVAPPQSETKGLPEVQASEMGQMIEDCAYVYGLVDPRNREIRYVGATVSPYYRMKGHRRNIKYQSRPMRAWVAELNGQSPVMVIYGRFKISEITAIERKFIDVFSRQGCRLINKRKPIRINYASPFDERILHKESGQIFPSMAAAGRAFGWSGCTIRNNCGESSDFEYRTLTTEQAKRMNQAKKRKNRK